MKSFLQTRIFTKHSQIKIQFSENRVLEILVGTMISFPKDKINVLLLENVHQDAFDMFRKDGFNVRLLPAAYSEKELLDEIESIHVLGIRSKTNVTPPVLEKAKRLLTIGCFCIGTNQVDLSGAEKKEFPYSMLLIPTLVPSQN